MSAYCWALLLSWDKTSSPRPPRFFYVHNSVLGVLERHLCAPPDWSITRLFREAELFWPQGARQSFVVTIRHKEYLLRCSFRMAFFSRLVYPHRAPFKKHSLDFEWLFSAVFFNPLPKRLKRSDERCNGQNGEKRYAQILSAETRCGTTEWL